MNPERERISQAEKEIGIESREQLAAWLAIHQNTVVRPEFMTVQRKMYEWERTQIPVHAKRLRDIEITLAHLNASADAVDMTVSGIPVEPDSAAVTAIVACLKQEQEHIRDDIAAIRWYIAWKNAERVEHFELTEKDSA